MKNKVVLLVIGLGMLLTGCTSFDALVVNGASYHVSNPMTNHVNLGLGVRKNGQEIGFYRNSWIKGDAYSVYASQRVVSRGRLFVDVGAAIYPPRDNSWKQIKPIVKAGMAVHLVGLLSLEVSAAAVDLVTMQVVWR
ncbi:hypothetical protein [Thiolinea disciformis]|uniref:hypothetical protein n=1 Tax=Thiolinea disciformis TaxID=125614 RepID=UPI0003782B0A|nr:hypothetical protein [Thiolinea disciformis]